MLPDHTIHRYRRALIVTAVALIAMIVSLLQSSDGDMLRGQLTDIGTKGQRTVSQISFTSNENSQVLPANNLNIILVPDETDIAEGVPLATALTSGKRIFGYKYSSRNATAEIAAKARAENGEPLSYSELFPGTFFASNEERSANTFVHDFEVQKNITFLPLSGVVLDRNARYAVIAGDGGASLKVRGFPRCGDGVVSYAHNEICDDGNNTDGDGCSATCRVEHSAVCAGQPSQCAPYAGQCTPVVTTDIIERTYVQDDFSFRAGSRVQPQYDYTKIYSLAGTTLPAGAAVDPMKIRLLGVDEERAVSYVLVTQATYVSKTRKFYRWILAVDNKTNSLRSSMIIPSEVLSFKLIASAYDTEQRAIAMLTTTATKDSGTISTTTSVGFDGPRVTRITFFDIDPADPYHVQIGSSHVLGNHQTLQNDYQEPPTLGQIDTATNRIYVAQTSSTSPIVTIVDGYSYTDAKDATQSIGHYETDFNISRIAFVPSGNILLTGFIYLDFQQYESVLVSLDTNSMQHIARAQVASTFPLYLGLPIPITSQNAVYLLSFPNIIRIDTNTLDTVEIPHPTLLSTTNMREVFVAGDLTYNYATSMLSSENYGQPTRAVLNNISFSPGNWDSSQKPVLRTYSFGCGTP